MDRQQLPDGFTLIEMVVVLLIIGLAAAVAAPALLRSRPVEAGFSALLDNARETAIRRGESVHLRIGTSGEWTIEGSASATPEVLVEGRVDPFLKHSLTLLVTPTGSCALDVPSALNAGDLGLDPLTCQVAQSSLPTRQPVR